MILRLRQLCCHPNLILVSLLLESLSRYSADFEQSRADDFENPTDLMGDDKDKELARAHKTMGASWVARVRGNLHRFVVFILIMPSLKGQKEVLSMPCRAIHTHTN
jgi:hypothetical protein